MSPDLNPIENEAEICHWGKEPCKCSRAWTNCKGRVGENNSREMQEAYRWLQETFGGCHCCERVCNQILRKGAFIAAHAVFPFFFFEITTCKLKNNVLCLITLDIQLKNPDDIILVHFHLFLKILYRLCKGCQ